MNKEFYFTLSLTENEHYIIENTIEEFCKKQGDLEFMYYRKFKTGHIPTWRECKIKGNIGKFKKWANERGIT